jgi:hypothetical protein
MAWGNVPSVDTATLSGIPKNTLNFSVDEILEK